MPTETFFPDPKLSWEVRRQQMIDWLQREHPRVKDGKVWRYSNGWTQTVGDFMAWPQEPEYGELPLQKLQPIRLYWRARVAAIRQELADCRHVAHPTRELLDQVARLSRQLAECEAHLEPLEKEHARLRPTPSGPPVLVLNDEELRLKKEIDRLTAGMGE